MTSNQDNKIERTVALCYVRKSLVLQTSDEISPARQRQSCIDAAITRGWIPELYEDAAGHRSGRTENRPGWLALKAQLNRPEIAAIIVESLSRATRSVRDLFNLLHELEARDIALISLKEQLDTGTAMGRAFLGFIAVMNQFESDIASERMTMNIAYKREHQGRHWGLTPYGCSRDAAGQLIPSSDGYWFIPALNRAILGNPTSPPFRSDTDGEWRGWHDGLTACYTLYATGEYGIGMLARELTARGYRFRNRRGIPRPWTADDVRRVLHAWRLYRGDLPLGRQKDGKGGRNVLRGGHQPILPPDTCNQVGAMLAERRRMAFNPGGKQRVYLLSGILFCTCGVRMVGQFQHDKKFYRHPRGKCPLGHRGHIPCADVDEQAMSLLELEIPDEARALIRHYIEDELEQIYPERNALQAAVRQQRRRLDNLLELRIEGEITSREYQRRKAAYTTELNENLARLAVIESPPDVHSAELLLQRLNGLSEIIRLGTPGQQKRALQAIFARIVQEDGQIVHVEPQPWARLWFDIVTDICVE